MSDMQVIRQQWIESFMDNYYGKDRDAKLEELEDIFDKALREAKRVAIAVMSTDEPALDVRGGYCGVRVREETCLEPLVYGSCFVHGNRTRAIDTSEPPKKTTQRTPRKIDGTPALTKSGQPDRRYRPRPKRNDDES